MLLTPELAQPIVERAMAILQRNVNIMDAAGVIVGSGDPTRIGNFHQGAAAVLKTGRRVEIQPEDVPNWGGVRMGVNLPLRLDGRIAGVVGITGLPDEVRPFGELIREMVQLMLSQAHTAELERHAALARESLLHALLAGSDELSERTVREAALHGLDEQTTYVVLVGDPAHMEPGDYTWFEPMASLVERTIKGAGIEPVFVTGPWEGRLVVVAGAEAAGLRFNPGAGATLAAGLKVVGLRGLSRSFRTALLALQAGRRLRGAGTFSADSLLLETMLATVRPEDAREFITRVLGGLAPASARETIDAFVGANLSIAAAAERLGIHRHTLMYRLDRIAESTGLDLRTWDGAVRLYLAVMLERMLGQNVHTN